MHAYHSKLSLTFPLLLVLFLSLSSLSSLQSQRSLPSCSWLSHWSPAGCCWPHPPLPTLNQAALCWEYNVKWTVYNMQPVYITSIACYGNYVTLYWSQLTKCDDSGLWYWIRCKWFSSNTAINSTSTKNSNFFQSWTQGDGWSWVASSW